MKKNSDLPPAPTHLKPQSAELWGVVVADYKLEPSDLRVLEVACTQFDRATAARNTIDELEAGPFIKDRFGQLKEHPAVGVERDAVRLFLAALRQLGLGLEPSSESMRLPGPRPPRERK